jgi:hypothetical protein
MTTNEKIETREIRKEQHLKDVEDISKIIEESRLISGIISQEEMIELNKAIEIARTIKHKASKKEIIEAIEKGKELADKEYKEMMSQ